MKKIVIGDVQGCLDELMELLDLLDFKSSSDIMSFELVKFSIQTSVFFFSFAISSIAFPNLLITELAITYYLLISSFSVLSIRSL